MKPFLPQIALVGALAFVSLTPSAHAYSVAVNNLRNLMFIGDQTKAVINVTGHGDPIMSVETKELDNSGLSETSGKYELKSRAGCILNVVVNIVPSAERRMYDERTVTVESHSGNCAGKN
jgi:hypothetical protein